MAIPLKPLELDRLSAVRVRYLRGNSRIEPSRRILVIKYTGVYRRGDAGEADARFLNAMGEAGVVGWEPQGVLIDLVELDGPWGVDLARQLEIGEKYNGHEDLPVALVVGARCEGLTRAMFTGPFWPYEWLFGDDESAWAFLEREIESQWVGFGPTRQLPGDVAP